MRITFTIRAALVVWLTGMAPACSALAQGTGPATAGSSPAESRAQDPRWSLHVQNTDILQGDPPFPARYSGPNSLNNHGEVEHTISVDVMAGLRLWTGADAYVDGLLWQGFGLSQTLGVDAFPNGEAFRLGTRVPNVNIPRLFLRQTIDLGGLREPMSGDDLHVGGRAAVNRITVTVGRFSAKDLFDNNAYANDPRAQFMNWGLMANEAWDYPGDSLGYITGVAVEWHRPRDALRYGIFQMPRVANGTALDWDLRQAWGMAIEGERRYAVRGHAGTIRFLGYLNHARMGSYADAVQVALATGNPADISTTRAYRSKSGIGLNWNQALTHDVGAFARLGWSDGQNEAWVFSDVDRAASAGLHLQGDLWHRADDVVGLAALVNGLSAIHQAFLAAGGLGILAGDGGLTYAREKVIEGYYDLDLSHGLHVTFDYQFVMNPAFNRARGPVSVLATRFHWEY